ncbi:hypothetical protein J6590_075176 [Homalodisca vitripennis]|nr:hypothetical protein J6590_075176 [Homalodisca vitripennis]
MEAIIFAKHHPSPPRDFGWDRDALNGGLLNSADDPLLNGNLLVVGGFRCGQMSNSTLIPPHIIHPTPSLFCRQMSTPTPTPAEKGEGRPRPARRSKVISRRPSGYESDRRGMW